MIDLADEIAYLTADLDDGVESGLLEIRHIREHVDILARCYAVVEREHVGVEEKYLFNEALQLMQHALTDDLIATTLRNVEAIGARLAGADVRRASAAAGGVLRAGGARAAAGEAVSVRHAVYVRGARELEHNKAEEVVTELFDFWIEKPEELPQGYLDQTESEGLARTVADYIAGMTDSFILLQYAAVKRMVRR